VWPLAVFDLNMGKNYAIRAGLITCGFGHNWYVIILIVYHKLTFMSNIGTITGGYAGMGTLYARECAFRRAY